jgi:hypothetical protein
MEERRTGTAEPEHAERVRVEVYRMFADEGHPPSRAALEAALGLSPAEVERALGSLAQQRHVVLDEHGSIVMAHPFAGINLGFSVMGEGTLWWGGCAWDSFAIPHLVPGVDEVLVATTCPACGTPHAYVVGTDEPPAGEEVAHFLVPAAHVWDDVVHTCSNQRIFCDEHCVDDWLSATGNERGSVFDLATLWRLAAHWYDGRLDSPYVRREPSEARAYFAEVGLKGAFWGLDDMDEVARTAE